MVQGCRKRDPFSPQVRWGDNGARRVMIGFGRRLLLLRYGAGTLGSAPW